MNHYAASEVDGFLRRVKWYLIITALIIGVPVLIYTFALNKRIASFEHSQQYRPPEEENNTETDQNLHQILAHPVKGQVIYVPAYSHIYHQGGKPNLLTITLSVRNTSIDHEIAIKSVRYYDTKGKEIKSYLKQPLRLAPLASTEFLVEREDTSGGSGASFLVEWLANQMVSEPIIEAVMIDTQAQQGISFVRSGKVIRELVPDSSRGILKSPKPEK